MNSRILSRGPEIDRQVCVTNANENMYNLIIAATARAREIRKQHRTSLKFEHTHSVVTALLEIQEGKVSVSEYLKRVR
jgi:DNA-directed RNA polymerase omega subunit